LAIVSIVSIVAGCPTSPGAARSGLFGILAMAICRILV